MPEQKKLSLKSIREEAELFDQQTAASNILKTMLEEERKPIHSVYEWSAPERVYEPKDKKWYLAVSTFSMFIVVLSLLTDNYGLVVAVVALIILLYALNSVPPQNLTHELTNKGISINSQLYTWKTIDKFWISKKSEHFFMNIEIETKNDDKDQIVTYLGDADVKKIISYMTQFIDYLPETEINNSFLNQKLFGTVQSLSSFMDKNSAMK